MPKGAVILDRTPRRRPIYFILAIVALVAAGFWLNQYFQSEQEPSIYEITGQTMGTSYSVKFRRESHSTRLPSDVRQSVEDVLQHVNRQMSTYDPESEISRFSDSTELTPQSISEDFFKVTAFAKSLAEKTQGRFDPTVAPLVNAWGFGPEDQGEMLPDSQEIDQLLQSVGHDNLAVDASSRKIAKRIPGLKLDLSAVAKGYAVDLVLLELRRLHQLEDILVEIGGELRASGLKAATTPWRVGVERPDGGGSILPMTLDLKDESIATSGNYKNYVESGGKRYSHIIDPTSGQPVNHRTVSTTVIHKECMVADGWATAFMVMPPEEAIRVADQEQLALYLIEDRGDGKLVVHSSQDFLQKYPHSQQESTLEASDSRWNRE